jgi:putative membrane protein (TIGR04086 family)
LIFFIVKDIYSLFKHIDKINKEVVVLNNSNRELNVATIFKGFIYAVTVSVILVLLISLIFYLTPLSEKFLEIISLLIIFTSVFIGGFIASKKAGTRGLVQGIGVGLIFLFFNLILSLLFGTDEFISNVLLAKTAASLIGGSLGGIIGISFAD